MFSNEEKAKIDELRNRVQDKLANKEQGEDDFLIRWLRARGMNVDKAEEMLMKSLAWRKETGADTILDHEDFPDKYKKEFMFAKFGEDEEGCPIILLPAGRHSHRKLLEAEGMDACLRWNIVWMEKLIRYIHESRERIGKPVSTYHEIIDMEFYSYKAFTHKLSVDYILQTQKMFDENYPEILKSVMVINAPKIFTLLFALLKPMIPKETLEKISIYAGDEEEWKQEFVRKGFPMHKIPPRWGGTLEGSDEFCSQEDVWVDAPIPLKNFREVPEEDEDGYFTVKVGARDKKEIRYEAKHEGENTIEYQFKTENHDIGFKLSFKDATSNQEIVLVPLERVDSNKREQIGTKTVFTKGTFLLYFDNKYSYTKSKTLKYKVKMSTKS